MNIKKLFSDIGQYFPFWFPTLEPVLSGTPLDEGEALKRDLAGYRLSVRFVLAPPGSRQAMAITRRIDLDLVDQMEPDDSVRVLEQVLFPEMERLEDQWFEIHSPLESIRAGLAKLKLLRLSRNLPTQPQATDGQFKCTCYFRHPGTDAESIRVSEHCKVHGKKGGE